MDLDTDHVDGYVVSFVVDGEPATQGSMRSLGKGRPTIDSNRDKLEPWRATVAARAREAFGDRPPLAGAVELDVAFVFARPKAHYRTGRHAGELKPSAPVYCDKRPDLDKLLRAIGDALTGVVLVDDGLIVELRSRKFYGRPSAQIAIRVLS